MVSLLHKPFSSFFFNSSLRTLFLQRFTITTLTCEGKFEGLSEYDKSTFIHPTAIVHPGAVIGQGVSIGPFCTVGTLAKLGNACRLYPGSHIFGDTELGENCVVMAGAIVGEDLPGRTTIGCNNRIGHHAVVGVKCQDMKYKLGDGCFLNVGDNNDFREYTSIHRSSKSSDRTVIGDSNLIMGSCHIAHDCKLGNNNILANNTLLAGHVVIEDYAHTAGAIVVHQFCHVGSFSFIGGGSVVAQDVPKYMMVAGDRAELRGLNLEGLRRHGFSSEEVRSMRRAYRKIFMPADAKSGGIEVRLTEVEKNEELAKLDVVCSMVQSIRDSFEQSRRGICKDARVKLMQNTISASVMPGGRPSQHSFERLNWCQLSTLLITRRLGHYRHYQKQSGVQDLPNNLQNAKLSKLKYRTNGNALQRIRDVEYLSIEGNLLSWNPNQVGFFAS